MMYSESLQKMRAIRRHHRRRIIRKRYEKVKMGHWYVKSPLLFNRGLIIMFLSKNSRNLRNLRIRSHGMTS